MAWSCSDHRKKGPLLLHAFCGPKSMSGMIALTLEGVVVGFKAA